MTTADRKPASRRLRITLRACAVLATLLAMLFAFVGFKYRQARVQALALNSISAEVHFEPRNGWQGKLQNWLPVSVQRAFGDTFFSKVVGLEFIDFTHEEMARCRELPDLEWIEIFSPEQFSAAGIRELSDHQHLVDFATVFWPMDTECVAAVSELHHLESLNIDSVASDGTSLSLLQRLDKLEYLVLSFEDPTDLQHARFPPNLKWVYLSCFSEKPFRAEDVRAAFSRYDRLEILAIGTWTSNGTGPVDPKMPEVISRFANLNTLNIAMHSSFGDDDLQHLSSLKQLVGINLRGTQVTGPGILGLVRALPKLKSVQHNATMDTATKAKIDALLKAR